MNRIFRGALAGTAFFMLIAAAGAQERDYDWYHHDRDDQYRGDRWRGRLFWQVREDLDHVQASTFGYGGDQYRIRQTKQELNELQEKLANGRYDERELDDVIGALQRVVAYNRLPPRDRDILQDDLHRLHEYREHHEGWGR